VKLINKHNRDKTPQYSELNVLPQIIEAKNAVLDGEVVVLKDGRPSFPTVMIRDHCTDIKKIAGLKNTLPVNYMVFDLLYLDGENLMSQDLSTRKMKLHDIFKQQDSIFLVEDFNEAELLFRAVESMGMEGIVAKNRYSSYIQGKKHKEWFKIKCRRTQNCLIGGYTLRGKMVNSILLGAYRDNNFIYIGRAGSGLSSAQQEVLSRELPNLQKKTSPFINLNKVPVNYFFIDPLLGVKIEFLEWTDDLHLRSPVIKDFLPLHPEQCTF
ncbi:MAG: hypothetical protein ABFD08_00480, partial [Syntrophomonas sp.]